jgi:D-glycero-alpha-D-manno-heptose 1-phosphate guanylyltransferase
MECIILAGGLGTRLKSINQNLPKSMMPINGRPFLEILLSSLIKKNFDRFILSIGYKSEVISNYFGYSFRNAEIIYEVEESPLGTGGAIRNALQNMVTQTALVLNGDTYFDFNPELMANSLVNIEGSALFGVHVADAARYGRILKRNDRLMGFAEKGSPGPALINSGHYLLKKELFDGLILPKIFSFEQDFLMRSNYMSNFSVLVDDGIFIDIGIPEDYYLAQTLLPNLSN